ncbi:RluA family pseudouridine synthase [Ideonella aquatica]
MDQTGIDDTDLDNQAETRAATVPDAAHGERLDRYLTMLAPEFSRSHLQSLVERGLVHVGGQPVLQASRRLKAGQPVEVRLALPEESLAFVPQAMDLAVLFEDTHLLVVNKPAGLVVHPAAGNWTGTLLNGLLARDPASAQLPRAGIVHRLDKDTSGLMVVARSLPAMTALVRDIAARSVRRRYLALAHGRVAAAPFSIDAPIGRDPSARVRMAVVAGGKPARTDIERLGLRGDISAVRCALHTGRTHQIRVHLASQGHPLVADAVYGGAPALGMTRQALHATELGFTHPINGEPMLFRCEPPADFAQAWQAVLAP